MLFYSIAYATLYALSLQDFFLVLIALTRFFLYTRRMNIKKCHKQGFSLVELSIVLVILGLLTGGILAGQSLIRAAELRSVSADINRYISATNTFRDKYMALPGDMRNAVRFWGAQAGATTDGTDTTCAALTVAAISIATCNGDGNGNIGNGGTVGAHEEFRAWQHLANAGLIEGSFTGIRSTAPVYSTPGVNIPTSKISTSGFGWQYVGSLASNGTYHFAGSYGTTLLFGAGHPTWYNSVQVLRAEEAWNIDTKMDDGKPASGIVSTFIYTSRPNCTDSDTGAIANYDLDNTAIGCPLLFKIIQ